MGGVTMEINLVVEGLKFMVLGMVAVFLFLMLMVIVLNLQAKIIAKYFPQKSAENTSSGASQAKSTNNNGALVAAITAAITEYRKS